MFIEHYAQQYMGSLAKTQFFVENDPKGKKILVWTNELQQQKIAENTEECTRIVRR